MKNENLFENDGLYLKGTVINSHAKAFASKQDGSITVMVTHEIAYGSEIVPWTAYYKPHEHPAIKMAGMEVLEYPKHERFQPIALKILRSKLYSGRLSITQAEVLDAA